jgi:hypothetical protein
MAVMPPGIRPKLEWGSVFDPGGPVLRFDYSNGSDVWSPLNLSEPIEDTDVLIQFVLYWTTDPDTHVTVPAGWTLIIDTHLGPPDAIYTGYRIMYCWRRGVAGETAPIARPAYSSPIIRLNSRMMVLAGCLETGDPIDAVNVGYATSPDPPSVTGVTTSVDRCAIFLSGHGAPFLPVGNPYPPDLPVIQNIPGEAPSFNQFVGSIYHHESYLDTRWWVTELPTAGSTGPISCTLNTQTSTMIVFAVKPAVAAPPVLNPDITLSGPIANGTEYLAYEVPEGQVSILQSVESDVYPQETWFKLPSSVVCESFRAWHNPLSSVYYPDIHIYYGTPGSLTLQDINAIPPFQMRNLGMRPVEGADWYIKITNSKNLAAPAEVYAGAGVLLQFNSAPNEDLAPGDILIPYYDTNSPICWTVIDPTIGGVKTALPLPNAQDADITPDNLIATVYARSPRDLVLLDSDLSPTVIPSQFYENSLGYPQPCITGGRANNFYVACHDEGIYPYENPTLWKFSHEGVLQGSPVTLPGVVELDEYNTVVAIAVDKDETVLYYVGDYGETVLRYDLVNGVLLDPLWQASVDDPELSSMWYTYSIQVLDDGTILFGGMGYPNEGPYFYRIYHVQPDGTLIRKYDFSDAGSTDLFNSLIMLSSDQSSFWVALNHYTMDTNPVKSSVYQIWKEVDIDTGDILNEFENVYAPWSSSSSEILYDPFFYSGDLANAVLYQGVEPPPDPVVLPDEHYLVKAIVFAEYIGVTADGCVARPSGCKPVSALTLAATPIAILSKDEIPLSLLESATTPLSTLECLIRQ